MDSLNVDLLCPNTDSLHTTTHLLRSCIRKPTHVGLLVAGSFGGYAVGSSFFHPSPPLFFHPLNPLTLEKREKRNAITGLLPVD